MKNRFIAALIGLSGLSTSWGLTTVSNFESVLRPFGLGLAVETDCEKFFSAANTLSGLDLYVGTAHCFREGKYTISAFLLSAGDIRLSVESEVFPVEPQDERSLFQAISLRKQFMSELGAESIFRSEVQFSYLYKLLSDWNPAIVASGFDSWRVQLTNKQAAVDDLNARVERHKKIRLDMLNLQRALFSSDEFYQIKMELDALNRKMSGRFVGGSSEEQRARELFSKLTDLSQKIAQTLPTISK